MELELNIPDVALCSAMQSICRDVKREGGRALLVGGCVRDAALGLSLNELDIEVYGIAPTKLRKRLATRYPFDLVGRAFPVLKLHGLPRRVPHLMRYVIPS